MRKVLLRVEADQTPQLQCFSVNPFYKAQEGPARAQAVVTVPVSFQRQQLMGDLHVACRGCWVELESDTGRFRDPTTDQPPEGTIVIHDDHTRETGLSNRVLNVKRAAETGARTEYTGPVQAQLETSLRADERAVSWTFKMDKSVHPVRDYLHGNRTLTTELGWSRFGTLSLGCGPIGLALFRDDERLPKHKEAALRVLLVKMGHLPSKSDLERTFCACLEAFG